MKFLPWAGLLGVSLWFAWDSLNFARLGVALKQMQAGVAPPHLHGAWGDLSDRIGRLLKLKNQQFVLSEQRMTDFLAAIQASHNGVVLLDKSNCIDWCNQTAAQQLGLDARRDIRQQIGNLVRNPEFLSYLQEQHFDREVVFAQSDSTAQRSLRVSLQLHPYGQGRKLLLTRDVTALEQADAMRRDFVANVSHEIRTPLTVLAGFIETLQHLPLDEAQRDRYLELMAKQSQRMQSLVNDLLMLSRLEGSPIPTLLQPCLVRTLLSQCEHDARALSLLLTTTGQGMQHRLHFESEMDISSVILGNSTELLSAMGNLVSNAVRYTSAGGSISALWRTLEDGRAQFTVQDTGLGIAAHHIPRLTERFYRIDSSRSRDSGGTGLGLAIVKHVVQRHGGELKIESTVGKGSQFGFILPAARIKTTAQVES